MTTIEEAFPRGRPGADKPHRRNKAEKPVKRKPADQVDDLFKPQNKQRIADSSKAKKKSSEDAASEQPEVVIKRPKDELEVQCSLLRLTDDLTPGMLVLGSIFDIQDYRLVVSLPGGLHGYVSISDICDPYTKDLKSYAAGNQESGQPPLLQSIFRVGQLVQCRVGDTSVREVEQRSKKSKKPGVQVAKVAKESVNLSVNPRLVNADLGTSEANLTVGMLISGAISSVEEKGYVIDLGLGPACKAFLKQKDAAEFEQQFNAGQRLNAYQVLPFTVAEVKPGFVGLILDNAIKKKEFENIPMRCILPGLLLQLDVLEQRRNGLVLQLTSGVDSSNPVLGCVNWRHLPASLETYKVGKMVSATVLYIDPLSKTLHCSLSRHLRKLNGFDGSNDQTLSSAIGTFFDESTVLHIDGKNAVVFEVDGPLFNRAYAKRDHLSDKKPESIDDQKFAPGTKHRCRVVGLSFVDGYYVVSLKQSVLDNKYLSLATITPGDKVNVTVEAVAAEGLRISLDQAKFIPGFIPWIHATEAGKESGSVALLEKRFPIGSKLKCRVINVEMDRRRLYLTLKKRLVKSKLPIFSDLASIAPESVSDGCIIKFLDKGLIIGFYNGVIGYLPRSLLPPYCRSVQDLKVLFHPGQVVQCRAKSVDSERRRLVVEMVVPDEDGASKMETSTEELSQLKSPSNKDPQPRLELGHLIENCKIVSKRENGFQVLIDEKTVATLPFDQLSDFPENCSILSKQLKVDHVFEEKLVVVSNKNRLIVSRKATLIEAIVKHRFVRSFDDMQPGVILAGWVITVGDYGILVAFPGNFVALAPKKCLADRFVVSPNNLFARGQSVLVKVIESSAEQDELGKHKCIVSLRMRDVCPRKREMDDSNLMVCEDGYKLFESFFEEQRRFAENVEKLPPIGSVIEVVVSEIDANSNEVTCKIEGCDDFLAKLPKEQMAPSFKNSNPTVGLKLKVVVLYHDLSNNRIEVTANPNLVSDVESKLEDPALPVLPGQFITSNVQLVRAGICAVVSLRDHATGRLAVVPAKRHINDVLEPFQFVQGQVNQVVIKNHQNLISAIFKLHNRGRKAEQGKEKDQEKESKSAMLPSGSIVSAEITNMSPTVLNLKIEGGKFRGRVHISETAPEDQQIAGFKPFETLHKGKTIQVRALGAHHRAHHKEVRAKMFECSLLLEKPAHRTRPLLGECDVAEGLIVPIFVKEYRHQFAMVEFSRLISRPGQICRLNVAQDVEEINHISTKFPPGTCLGEALIIRTSPYVEFSLVGRPSAVEPGKVYQGFIFAKSCSTGLQVAFADGSIGHVALTDMNDEFTSFPTKAIPQSSVTSCFVMKRLEDGMWQLSVRPSRLVKSEDVKTIDREIDSVADLVIGDRLRGFVVVCKEHSGVFVRLGRNVVGRASFEHTSEYFLVNPEQFFQPGLVVRAKVIGIDYRDSTRHVEISLLEQDTGEALNIPNSLLRGKRKELTNPAAKQEAQKRSRTESSSSVQSAASVSSISKKIEQDKEPVIISELPKFDFTQSEIMQPPLIEASSGMEIQDDEENAEVGEGEKKKKKESAREREHRTYAMEIARLKGADDPEASEPKSVDDFDRLAIEKPNSSLIWARYIAFHLTNLDIAKAREVAERALKSVSFREETERLNIWVSYFNLENLFGNDDSLRDVVRRACQEADPLAVYDRLVDVYVKSEKFEAAEHQLSLLTKKFRENPTVWLKQGEFLFQHGKLDAARGVMNKALDALDVRHHVDLIVKFALLEMSSGDFERGRSLFEKVVTNYPKRLDVWNVYIDALLKKGNNDVVGARRLYERQVALRLPYNKARLVFRKFAAFEKQFGDDESMAKVEELAKQFLEQQSTKDENDSAPGQNQKKKPKLEDKPSNV